MTDKIKKKIILIGILIILLSTSYIPASGSDLILKNNIFKNYTTRTWIIDDEGDGDFTHIQDALDVADPGDIIKVYSGTYIEQLVVNVDNIFIEGINFELGTGQDLGNPIIDGNKVGDVIYIKSDRITLNGFIVKNSGKENIGVYIHSNNNLITENIIINNDKGIYIYDSSYNTISNNNLTENTEGIYLDNSNINTIDNNNIFGNKFGMYTKESEKNTITNNIIEDNENGVYYYFSHSDEIKYNEFINNINGIHLTFGSNNNKIKENIASDNDNGLKIVGSSSNEITSNDILKNTNGLYFDSCSYNLISKNNINTNEIGIKIIGFRNTISENSIFENSDIGIYIGQFSHNNTINNNNISSVAFKDSILFEYSTYNTISNNQISGSGILFFSSNINTIYNNIISKSFNGLYFNNSLGNIIFNNTICLCNFDAVYLCKLSCNNTLYHNHFIENHQNAYDLGENIWDNGYPSGGNHWSDFDESSEGAFDQYSGPNQNQIHSDGIVDTPYIIPGGNNTDNYPLMIFWGPPSKPERPRGIINGKTGRNYAYSTVSTDPEDDKIQYGWDWDGDNLVDDWTQFYESGVEITTSHSWETEGSYEIYVRAMDEYGTLSEWSDPLRVNMPKQKFISSVFTEILESMKFIYFFKITGEY